MKLREGTVWSQLDSEAISVFVAREIRTTCEARTLTTAPNGGFLAQRPVKF